MIKQKFRAEETFVSLFRNQRFLSRNQRFQRYKTLVFHGKNCKRLYVNVLSVSGRDRMMIYGECGEIVLFRDKKAVNDGR